MVQKRPTKPYLVLVGMLLITSASRWITLLAFGEGLLFTLTPALIMITLGVFLTYWSMGARAKVWIILGSILIGCLLGITESIIL